MQIPWVKRADYDKLLEENLELQHFVDAMQEELRIATVDAEQYKTQCQRLNDKLEQAKALLKHYRGDIQIGGDINLQ